MLDALHLVGVLSMLGVLNILNHSCSIGRLIRSFLGKYHEFIAGIFKIYLLDRHVKKSGIQDT
jgi:hypothetical protein